MEVTNFDSRLREDVDWMRGIMDGAVGIGLAATQVGTLARVLVYRVEAESPTIAVINPRIEWSGEEMVTLEEGCLSIPGIRVDVERALHLRVGCVDEYGEARTIEASGLEARVLAHEIDHLDGVLMLDRADKAQRREAMRACLLELAPGYDVVIISRPPLADQSFAALGGVLAQQLRYARLLSRPGAS